MTDTFYEKTLLTIVQRTNTALADGVTRDVQGAPEVERGFTINSFVQSEMARIADGGMKEARSNTAIYVNNGRDPGSIALRRFWWKVVKVFSKTISNPSQLRTILHDETRIYLLLVGRYQIFNLVFECT
jgi:hypothetical protein